MRLPAQILAVAAAGTLAGLAANAASAHPAALGRPVRPTADAGAGLCSAGAAPGADRPAPVRRVDVAEATRRCAACTAGFVDARTAAEFAGGHVAGAIHLPPSGHPDEATAIAALRAFPLVVVYDGGYACALAEDVARRLARAGLPDVRVLDGGWSGWLAAGGPGESGACSACEAVPEARR